MRSSWRSTCSWHIRASIPSCAAPNPPAGDPICAELADPTSCYYLYYVIADEDGGHVFASELWQHERNVEVARQAIRRTDPTKFQ